MDVSTAGETLTWCNLSLFCVSNTRPGESGDEHEAIVHCDLSFVADCGVW